MKINKPKQNRRKIFSVVAAILVVLLAAGATWWWFNRPKDAPPSQPETPAKTKPIDNSSSNSTDQPTKPATENTEKDAENETADTPSSSQTDKHSVDVLITDASQYGDSIEIRAYANTVESDGTCEISLTLGDKTITRQVATSQNVSTTDCMTTNISLSEISVSGTWQATVKYSSSQSTGSATQNVMIVR
jgi:cytoskeletal protein RodZ